MFSYTELIQSDTGGFILVDPHAIARFHTDLASCMNVVFDVAGSMYNPEEYPEADWPIIWKSACHAVAHLSGPHQLLVVLIEQGAVYVRIQDSPLNDEEVGRVGESHSAFLRISRGELALCDGTFFFDAADLDEDDDPLHRYDNRRMPVPPAVYQATVNRMQPPPSEILSVGLFGTEANPAVIVNLTRTRNEADADAVVFLDTKSWTSIPIPGALCEAEVLKIVNHEAWVNLYMTHNTNHGKAKFHVPDGMVMKIGTYVWVKLIDFTGTYWIAELEHVE